MYTVLKAIVEVAKGLDINLRVEHANRMTSAGDRVADALSKNDKKRAEAEWGNARPKQEKVPTVLLNWINQPKLTRTLAQDILDEIKKQDGEKSVIDQNDTGVRYTKEDWGTVRNWYINERKKEQTRHAINEKKRKREELEEVTTSRKASKWWCDGTF